jgi:hypothetical protein
MASFDVDRERHESLVSFTSAFTLETPSPTHKLSLENFSNKSHLLRPWRSRHLIVDSVEKPHHKFMRIMMVIIIKELIERLNPFHQLLGINHN